MRKSACQSLHRLTILSVEFARETLDLLMDMLNDDSMVVRLQTLETMHRMAINSCLKLQEKHLHMVSFWSFISRCLSKMYLPFELQDPPNWFWLNYHPRLCMAINDYAHLMFLFVFLFRRFILFPMVGHFFWVVGGRSFFGGMSLYLEVLWVASYASGVIVKVSIRWLDYLQL